MSIWRRIGRAVGKRCLAQDCLLCGRHGADDLLCSDCRSGLPSLPAGCPVCAAPGPAGRICGACQKIRPGFDSTRAPLRYAFPVDKLVHALKYRHRLAVGRFLGRLMLAGERPAGDLIVPLPLSPQRLRERGFNQAVEIARPLASALALPLSLSGFHRHRHTPAQAILPWPERRRNICHAFACDLDLDGRRIIVIDDVMTSGATLDEFARLLKAGGAAEVHAWVAARAVPNTEPGQN